VQAKTGLVQIGSTVTIVSGTMKQRFHILGSTEADPMKGIISYQSPLGGALLNHAVGDTVKLEIGERKTDYQIVAID
jgi:transcription elongation factor GreA